MNRASRRWSKLVFGIALGAVSLAIAAPGTPPNPEFDKRAAGHNVMWSL